MTPLRPALILTPLALAGAAAMLWPAVEKPAAGKPGEADRDEIPARPAKWLPRAEFPAAPSAPADDWLAVPGTPASEPAARRRFAELDRRLALDPRQRHEVRRLVIRSTPGYDPGRLAAPPGVRVPPLSQTAADEAIHALLDPLQQADFEDMLLDREAWWSEVIARLESDLEQATDPAAPAAELPAAAPMRNGGNLFDLLDPQR